MRFGRWTSRVRGLLEVYGELPVACLAEEIDTPGEGQVRALVTVAGNPLVSTPNGARLERAVGTLEFRLALDIYVNETTRHADVILPAPEPLEKSHYDVALYQLAARNVANYSPPVFNGGGPDEWQALPRLAGVVAGQGPNADLDALDRLVVETVVRREVAQPGSAVEGRDPDELLAALERAAAPSGFSTSCCGSAPTATASMARTAASPSRCSSATRTAWISGRSSPGSPRPFARLRA